VGRAKRIVPECSPARSVIAQPAVGERVDMAELWRFIATQIALWRGRRELSQQMLAELAGRSASWLSKVERGDRKCDSLEALCDLAAALRVPPTALLQL
jgi:predicted transcriptional regulator